MKCSVLRVELDASRATSAALDSSISITGIRTVSTEIQNPGIAWFDSPPSWAARGLSVVSGMRGAIQDITGRHESEEARRELETQLFQAELLHESLASAPHFVASFRMLEQLAQARGQRRHVCMGNEDSRFARNNQLG